MGSAWDRFLNEANRAVDPLFPDNMDSVADAAENIGKAFKAATSLADRITPDEYTTKAYTYPVPGSAMRPGAPRYEQGLPTGKNPVGQFFNIVTAPIQYPVRTASEGLLLLDRAISEPASTLFQATYAGNPLYRDGLQLSDFVAMAKTAQKFSPGSAWQWRDMAESESVLPAFARSPLVETALASLRPAEVNIYNPEERRALQDDPLFSIQSGLKDVAFQILAGTAVDSAAMAGAKAVGLSTKIDSVRQLDKLAATLDAHVTARETAAPDYVPSFYGRLIDQIAESTSAADIANNPLIRTSPKRFQISSMLEPVSDLRTISSVVLADKGDVNAIAALLRNDQDWAFEMADMKLRMQLETLMSGAPPTITRDNAEVYARIYDRPLERPGNEFYRNMRDMLLSTETNPADEATGLYTGMRVNNPEIPASGPLAQASYALSQEANNIRMGIGMGQELGDGWAATVLGDIGSSKPVTIIAQWLGGRRPQGFIPVTNLEPTAAVDEMLATIGMVKWLRGQRSMRFVRGDEVIEMNGPQFRAEAISRLSFALNQGDTAVVNEVKAIETELISMVVQRFGLTADEATSLAQAAVAGKNASIMDTAEIGFFFDDSANLVRIVPDTQRQLVDNYVMFPIADFAREARMLYGGLNRVQRTALRGRQMTDMLYETVQKYMRVQQLIKPAYLKNSIAEPAGAMLASLGVDELPALSANATVGFKNFYINRARELGLTVLRAGDSFRVTGKGRADASIEKLNRELRYQQERLAIETQLEYLDSVEQLAKGEQFSPAYRAHLEKVADTEARTLRTQLGAIYRKLDIENPNWDRLFPEKRFSDLRAEVNDLANIVDNPTVLSTLRSQIDLEQSRSQSVFDAARRQAEQQLQVNRLRAAEIRRQLALPSNEELAAQSAEQAQRRGKILELRRLEARLAWAERAAAGSNDMNASARTRAQARLDDAIVQRERLLGEMPEAGDQLAMDATAARKTKAVLALDRQIARLEAELESLTIESLPVPYRAQEVLDTYPAQIQALRNELGDTTDDLSAEAARMRQEETEALQYVNDMRKFIGDTRKEYRGQIDSIRAGLPKVEKTDDPEALQDWRAIVSSEETERLRKLATQEIQQEAEARLVNEVGDELDPEWIVQYLSAADEKVWRAHGIVPLETMRKLFMPKNWETGGIGQGSEEIWAWYHHGAIDSSLKVDEAMSSASSWGDRVGGYEEMAGLAFPWKAAKSNKRGRKGAYQTSPVTSAEMRGLLNGEISAEDGFYLVQQRSFSKEQAEALRKLGYNVRATTRREAKLYVRPPWSQWVAKEPLKEKVESRYNDYLLEAQEYADRQYAEGLGQIAELESRRDAALSVAEKDIARMEEFLTELRSSPDYPGGAGKKPLPSAGDPVPSPFDRMMAQRELDRLERQTPELEAAVNRQYKPTDRLLDLQRRADRAEKLLAADPETRALVRKLQDIADDAARARLAFSATETPQQKQRQLEDAIAKLEAKIGALKDKSADAVARRARLAERKRQYESEVTLTTAGGTQLTGPQLFNRGDFGTALRNQFSAAYSSRATFDPSEVGAANARVLGMAQGSMTVQPADPRYLSELVYVSNRHVTGDEFARLVLSGWDNARIMKWGQSPAGQKYLRQMGWKLDELNPSITSSVRDQVDPQRSVPVWDNGQINNLRNILNAYYPTPAARQAVLDGEVTIDQMQAALRGVPIEELSPIQGRAIEMATGGWRAPVEVARKGINFAWDALATNPENMFRFTFAGKFYEQELVSRLNVLESQGVRLSNADWNAQKEAAKVAALAESRKTFYNIVRYSNPVYASRYLFVYPQAVFNTLYRAARFTARRPGTAMVMNNAWTQFFTANGLDANGNPTEDYSKAEYITIDVPDSMRGITRNWGIDDKMRWPVKTWELVSDKMGASWTVQIPAQTLLVHKPDANDELKAILGDQYRFVFPFDTPSGLTDFMAGGVPLASMIPGWAKSLWRSFTPSDDQYLRISTQILEHDLADYFFRVNNYSANSFSQFTDPGPMPTPDSAAKKATNYLRAAALGQFTVPGGAGIQASGQVEVDGIRKILAKYNFDREAALPEVLQAFPDIDPTPLMQSTSEYSAYVPSTIEAFELVTDPALQPLFGQITSDANADPQYIELLVADKSGTFDPNVYDALGNLKLPGSNEVVRSKISNYVINGRIEASKSWEVYDKARANFDAEMIRLGRRSYTDSMQEQWNEWFNEFIDQPENKTFFTQYSQRNAAKSKLALDTLVRGLEDPAMAPYRDSVYWQVVDKYLQALPFWISAYRAAESGERKDELKAEWAGTVAYEYSAISPEFGRVYNKFLADYDLEVKGNGLQGR